MPKKIRVSRHGLTTCPSCSSHIQVASKLEETRCPFCGAGLAQEAGRTSLFGQGMQGLLSASKSGVLAASLVGLVSVVGCTEEPEPEPDMAMEQDMPSGQDMPAGQDMKMVVDQAPDIIATPEYGVAPILDMGGEADSGQDAGVDMGASDAGNDGD